LQYLALLTVLDETLARLATLGLKKLRTLHLWMGESERTTLDALGAQLSNSPQIESLLLSFGGMNIDGGDVQDAEACTKFAKSLAGANKLRVLKLSVLNRGIEEFVELCLGPALRGSHSIQLLEFSAMSAWREDALLEIFLDALRGSRSLLSVLCDAEIYREIEDWTLIMDAVAAGVPLDSLYSLVKVGRNTYTPQGKKDKLAKITQGWENVQTTVEERAGFVELLEGLEATAKEVAIEEEEKGDDEDD